MSPLQKRRFSSPKSRHSIYVGSSGAVLDTLWTSVFDRRKPNNKSLRNNERFNRRTPSLRAGREAVLSLALGLNRVNRDSLDVSSPWQWMMTQFSLPISMIRASGTPKGYKNMSKRAAPSTQHLFQVSRINRFLG